MTQPEHRRGVSAQYQGGRLMSQFEVENGDLSGHAVADLVVTLADTLDELASHTRHDHDRIALRVAGLWRELTWRGLEL